MSQEDVRKPERKRKRKISTLLGETVREDREEQQLVEIMDR